MRLLNHLRDKWTHLSNQKVMTGEIQSGQCPQIILNKVVVEYVHVDISWLLVHLDCCVGNISECK